ncbi:MAG: hypothetical protein ABIZ56_03960 [Chthoniobacteraceae bacterium]
MDAPLDFFVHIPKTAGLTMLGILREQYPPGAILSLRGTEDAARPALLAGASARVRVVAGHVHANFSRHLPRPCRLFTILREPVERVLSLYYFVAREKGMGNHEAVVRGDLTIEEMARRHGSMQARYVAGYDPAAKVPDDQLLREAKATLADQIAVFGLTERFDESLLLFNAALGWNVRGYRRENVTRKRPQRETIAPANLETVRGHSAIDLVFYEFARELFARRILEQPPDFAERLAALRRGIEKTQRFNVARTAGRLIWRTLGLRN